MKKSHFTGEEFCMGHEKEIAFGEGREREGWEVGAYAFLAALAKQSKRENCCRSRFLLNGLSLSARFRASFLARTRTCFQANAHRQGIRQAMRTRQ